MSELYTELEFVLAMLPASLLDTLAESFHIHLPEDFDEEEVAEYRMWELAFTIVERVLLSPSTGLWLSLHMLSRIFIM